MFSGTTSRKITGGTEGLLPRFEVLRQVGRGGMGMVFEALYWKRYRREALNAPAGIVHRNPVTLYGLMLTGQ